MPKTLREITYDAILDALIRNKASRTHASLELGIHVRTVRHLIKEMRQKGIAVPDGRASSGMERLMKELQEYRTGVRKAQEQSDYCRECGRLLTTHGNTNQPKPGDKRNQG